MDRYRGPHLLRDPAAGLLERPLEPADRFPAEGVVKRNRSDGPVAECAVGVLTERMIRLAAGVSGTHDPLAALPLRQIVGGHHRVHHRNPHRVDVRRQRVAGRRQQRAGHQVHLVALDQLPGLRQPDRRDRFGVFDDELNLASAGAIADLVEQQEEPVQNVAPALRVRTRHRYEEADLDRALGGLPPGQGARHEQRRHDNRESKLFHRPRPRFHTPFGAARIVTMYTIPRMSSHRAV